MYSLIILLVCSVSNSRFPKKYFLFHNYFYKTCHKVFFSCKQRDKFNENESIRCLSLTSTNISFYTPFPSMNNIFHHLHSTDAIFWSINPQHPTDDYFQDDLDKIESSLYKNRPNIYIYYRTLNVQSLRVLNKLYTRRKRFHR